MTWGAAVAALALAGAMSLPLPGYAGDLHAQRTELAEARAALDAALHDGARVSHAGLARGASFGARSSGSRDPAARSRVLAADRRLRQAEAAVDETVAAAAASNVVVGLVEQARTLVRGSRDPATAGRLDVPLRGVVTSGFGPRRVPSWDEQAVHEGIDVFALPGTPVRAGAAGVVVFAGDQAEAGLSVVIDHGEHPDRLALRTVYGHLSHIDVAAGTHVDAGQQIGAVGTTGRHSTGPHLHFEVHVEGQPVDPRAWL